MKKLFLLDGMALIYRAHFALSKAPRFTASGLNTSAMLGFTNTLLEVIKKESPTHIAVVFDTSAPTARHEEFPDYKGHREAMPEDLRAALPYVKRITEGFNIPVITLDGYEADDLIGTLAKMAEQKGFETYMMTPDKDFAQLVSDKIFVYKPARLGDGAEVLGVKEVLEKWEIERVEQVIDILGLWGDAVDNIPGIPGIGEKTAKALIKKYDSMEGIFAHSHELKGKQKENVETYKEQGLLSKRLATIILNAPVELDEERLLLTAPNKEVLEPIFAELEFRTLGRRVFGEQFTVKGGQASQAADLFNQNIPTNPIHKPVLSKEEKVKEQAGFDTMENKPHNYTLVNTAEGRKKLIAELDAQSSYCFDTETTGIDANDCELVGLAFSWQTGTGFYVPIPEDQAEAKAIVAEFKTILENPKTEKVGQNIKYDILIMKWYGVELAGPLFDTMLAHYLIDADGRHGMDILAESYLNYSPVSIAELIGKKGKTQGTMRDVQLEKAAQYASEDVDITLQLKDVFAPILSERNANKLANEVEYPLVYVLADMEHEGIRIDKQALLDYSIDLGSDITRLEKQIYEKAGLRFNIASPKQLGEVLFDHLKLDEKAKKTKTGQYQTSEDVLQLLAPKHEMVQDVLDFRQLQKLKSTYVDTLPTMINPKTGRVHTSFSQAVAATGRLSSNNPNLQNIPIKTEKGREVRRAFIARDEDHVLLSADYSQIELRIITEISKDANMQEAFVQGLDIHRATAAKVYGVSLEEVTGEQRRNAKAVNFGIIYGQSAFGLSQSLNIPRKEAADMIAAYFEQYPGIKQYMIDSVEFARKHGYVETILGRRRYLRDINSANGTIRSFAERNAVNAPIQGSAADLIKVAMINIHKELKQLNVGTKMILQVHDELIFDVPRKEVEMIKPIIERLMQEAIPMNVPVLAEAGIGENWLEAH